MGDMSPAARTVGAIVLVLAVAWTFAGERVMDAIDSALTRDAAGCEHSGDPASDDLRSAEAATFCLLNHERERHGRPRLARDERLDVASRRHSRDMARRDFFAHRGPDGSRPVQRMRAAGWPRARRLSAENLAWGEGRASSPAEIVEGWMDSPGHRANILHPRLRWVGVGIVSGSPEAI